MSTGSLVAMKQQKIRTRLCRFCQLYRAFEASFQPSTKWHGVTTVVVLLTYALSISTVCDRCACDSFLDYMRSQDCGGAARGTTHLTLLPTSHTCPLLCTPRWSPCWSLYLFCHFGLFLPWNLIDKIKCTVNKHISCWNSTFFRATWKLGKSFSCFVSYRQASRQLACRHSEAFIKQKASSSLSGV